MANILLNEISSNPSGYVFFTDIPNILSIDDYNSGIKARIEGQVENGWANATSTEGQWYIKINGETITSTLDYNNAKNKNFYISSDKAATAYYITRALRNCPIIAANFNIPSDGTDYVYMVAKKIGDTPIEVETNCSTYFSIETTAGTSSSSLDNAPVDVQIESDDEYIVTLEKNAYNAKTAFDLSPVLATIAEYGKTKPFSLMISSLRGDEMTVLGNISGNHISNGYKANDSLDYIYRGGGIKLAQHIAGKLYIYDPYLPISFYNPNNNGGATIIVTYKDSLGDTLYTYTTTWHRTDSSKHLIDYSTVLDSQYLHLSASVNIKIGNEEAEYEVIKPVRAAEGNTRLYWRNEYAGVSFFDFTGEKSFTNSISNETYEKNLFDYYTTDMQEEKKLYEKTATKTVTLNTHLISKEGIWIFESLKKAKKVWLNENGIDKAVIITSVSVKEESNTNDVYTATVNYTYSNESLN